MLSSFTHIYVCMIHIVIFNTFHNLAQVRQQLNIWWSLHLMQFWRIKKVALPKWLLIEFITCYSTK